MNLRNFLIIEQGPDSSYEHVSLRKEFGYDFLMLEARARANASSTQGAMMTDVFEHASKHVKTLPAQAGGRFAHGRDASIPSGYRRPQAKRATPIVSYCSRPQGFRL